MYVFPFTQLIIYVGGVSKRSSGFIDHSKVIGVDRFFTEISFPSPPNTLNDKTGVSRTPEPYGFVVH